MYLSYAKGTYLGNPESIRAKVLNAQQVISCLLACLLERMCGVAVLHFISCWAVFQLGGVVFLLALYFSLTCSRGSNFQYCIHNWIFFQNHAGPG